jgi:hypothetical protein
MPDFQYEHDKPLVEDLEDDADLSDSAPVRIPSREFNGPPLARIFAQGFNSIPDTLLIFARQPRELLHRLGMELDVKHQSRSN